MTGSPSAVVVEENVDVRKRAEILVDYVVVLEDVWWTQGIWACGGRGPEIGRRERDWFGMGRARMRAQVDLVD